MTILEKAIEKFIKEIDEELNVTFDCNRGYCFETSTNTVNVDLTDTEDCGFMRHLKEFHKCEFAYEYSLCLWSILHEIGHYETEGDLVESDDDTMLRFYLMFAEDKNHDNIELQNQYFNLPAEWYATEWAIEWIEENPTLAKKFKV